ncbi:PAS domain-containing sensor histidine kinase [Leptospira idonii]|uniref:histidine kinase n=1 Tax=Leptospira idonii TaxID=1193500 RepID=A0A4R9M0M2_9LEPT|nr:PAS domain-containing sensor histidine kinase [Leptospira idonii]TGN19481.1 PAS domain-containing sensor histidine kinase [Leptospira idonii]
MNEFFEKIKGFFKDEPSFVEAKQLLLKNWEKITPPYLYGILETVRDSVFILDTNWTYLYLNSRALEMVGMESSQIIGKEIWELFPQVKDSEIGKKILIAVNEKRGMQFEEVHQDTERWYDLSVHPSEKYIFILGKEVTSQKKVEKGYESAVSKNRAILNSIPDKLYRIHKDGTVIDYKMFPDFADWETPAQNTDGMFNTMESLFPEDRLDSIRSMIFQVLTLDLTQTVEYSKEEYDGTKFYEARIAKSGNDEVLAIIRNITERKRTEQLKNEFISLVSHELRTPLTSVKGAIELLIGGVAGELSNQAKSLLNICRKNTLRLVRFVTDLLDIEALDSGNINFKYKSYFLEEIVQTSIDGMRTFAEQYHVLLNYVKEAESITVFVDEDRLNHCITNLISNAVKYTPKYSEVMILVGRGDSEAYIKVSDKGPGIDPVFQPRLFHRFTQGAPPKDKLVGGTGLGLSITKGFVEAMKGTIDFETGSDGSTFIIKLPLYETNHFGNFAQGMGANQ